MLAGEFVLLSVSDDDDGDDVGALTAQVGDFDVLVAFTSKEAAGVFVDAMSELFGDEEGVDGIFVEGGVLLQHLPGGHGLLIDPESENASLIDPALAADLR